MRHEIQSILSRCLPTQQVPICFTPFMCTCSVDRDNCGLVINSSSPRPTASPNPTSRRPNLTHYCATASPIAFANRLYSANNSSTSPNLSSPAPSTSRNLLRGGLIRRNSASASIAFRSEPPSLTRLRVFSSSFAASAIASFCG